MSKDYPSMQTIFNENFPSMLDQADSQLPNSISDQRTGTGILTIQESCFQDKARTINFEIQFSIYLNCYYPMIENNVSFKRF